MKVLVNRFVADESGSTAIEYGLIAAIVAIGIVASLQTLRTSMQNQYVSVNAGFSN